MAEVLINLFEDSDSFAEARTRVSYLEEFEVWDSGFIPRIQSAAEANSQITGSYGVPARVNALAKKWAARGA